MKSKKYFLGLLLLAALLLPGVTLGQVAKVSEYDFDADTVAYASIVGNGGTAWSATDRANGYTTITMPFAMQYGQTSIGRGATLYVSSDGYVTTGDATMTGIVIAPLSTTAGFTGIGANTIYTKVESNKVTVEWRKLKVGNNMVSFQLVLTNTGAIKFQYGPMTLSTTAQVFAAMQSSSADIYNLSTVDNRWDTIVPTYLSLTQTRTLSPTVHPYYDVNTNQGLCYTFTQPECAKPNSFGAVPGDNNVIFNWTGNGTKYQIKYNEGSDFTPMTEGTLIDNLTGTSYTLSNLPQRTTYYAYIRAYCATSGSWSAWRAIADESFSTGCGFEPLPMVQDFTSALECWDMLTSNSEATYTAWLSNDMLYMRAGDEGYGYANDVFAALPKFNTSVNLNNYEFDLTASCESAGNGTLTLGYLTNINNIAGFVALTDIPLTTTPQDIALYLTDYAAIPSGARLALKWSYSSSYWDCYIDQIEVKPQPTCFPISNLQVTDINPTSAKFTFVDNHNTSTGYQLVYGAPGFDPDAATPVAITNGGTINNLEGSTRYEAYVRAICGSESNAWVGPVSFFTPCPISCQLSVYMEDSYNDGWNGAYISVLQNGEEVTTITCEDGETGATQNFTLCGGALYSLVWHTGSYDNECTMTITHNGVDIYDGGAPGAGTFVNFKACPTCEDPKDLAISASKVLTWTAGDATQWQVRYKRTTDDTYTTLIVNAATATLPLTGAAGTQYEISVRSICGAGDTLLYVAPVYYTMPLSLPYSCDFENGATGFITQSTGSNEWVLGTAKSNGGSYGYYVSNDGVTNAYSHGNNIAYTYVTLPFETAGDYIVKYDWTANGESTWDFLRVALVPDNVTLITSYSNSYNSTTPSGWIAIDGGSKLNLNTNWNTRTEAVTITEPGNYKLVFAWMNDGSGGSQPPAAIDNVSVRMLSCNMPTNIALNSDGAVAWTAGTTTQWQVRWAEQGSSNYTEAIVSTPSYTSTTWTPNTSYTVDIRSICGANDTLDWATYNFTMPCVAIAISDASPYSENFESYTNAPSGYESAGADVPECWDLIPAMGVVTRAPHVGTQGAINGKGLVMTAGNSNCWPNNYAILPAFTAPVSLLQINFDYKCESASSNWLSIGYITNPNDTSSFVALATYNGSSSVASKEFSFAGNTIPAGARIAFRWYRSSSYYWINIDNVVVSVVPTCVKPVVTAATTTTSGAEIAWTEINSATTWRLLYGPAGFNPETQGTMMTATTNPATISGLNANTSYDVYVRSVCEAGVDSSAWSNAYNFRTACGAIQPLPYSEDFNGYTGLASYPYTGPSVTPNCWYYYSNGTNTAATTGSSYYGGVAGYNGTSYGSMVSNDKYLYLPVQLTGANVTSSTYLNYGTLRGDVKVAAMPLFEQSLSNLLVSFNYKMSTAYSATGAAAVLELGYITEDDASTFQSMQSWNAVTTTQSVEVSLDVLAANAPADARLAFRFSGVHNGTYTSSYTNVACGIDNILVKVIPNCFAPLTSSFAASDVTPTSATVSWTDRNTNTPNAWKVKCSATAIDPSTEGTATTVTTESIDLTGLEPQTTYYIYVGVDCGAFGESEWSDAFTFTTPCAYYNLPFAENFDANLSSDICWCGATGTTAEQVFNGTALTLTTPNWSYASSANSGLAAGHYYKNIYGTSCKSWIITPIIDLTTAPSAQLTFDAVFTGYNSASAASGFADNSTQAFMVLISTDGGLTWPEANAIKWQNAGGQHTLAELCGTSYMLQVINLSQYLGQTIRIAFYAQSTVSGGDNNMHIDNILVDVIPPCAKPTGVHTTSLAYNAATIDWTQNTTLSTETSWEVMFGESPLDVDNATVTTLTDHVFNATNLVENTTYDFYVRPSCGADGYGDWSNVFTFTTPCAPIAVTKYQPYIYGFEDATGSGAANTINSCWAKGTNSSTKYPYPYSSNISYNTNPITGTNSYHLYMYGTATYYSYAVLPEFSNPINTLQMSLKVMKTSTTATYGKVVIGVMTDPTDINTFIPVDTVQPDATYSYQTFTTFFDNYTGANGRIAFRTTNEGTCYAYVDDIEVMPIPTCRVATNLTSENVYARTANLSWTESSATTPAAWELRYALADADLDYEGVSVEVTGTPATLLQNLVPETGYQWKVRAICVAAANNEGDTADWSEVATFTTTATCVVPTVGTPVASANSVTLSWNENTMPVPATSWEVAVGEAGFNPSIAGQHFTTSQNTNFVVEGLRHSTNYQVYVRSLCSDEDWSEWSEAVTFNTTCAPWQYADMPLVQTFSVAGLPSCWTKAGGTANVNAANNRMNIYGTNSMVVLPEMGFALDTIEMSLEAANYNGTTERTFEVGYLADDMDTSTFTVVESITLSSAEYTEFNISFADINNTTGRYIAIRGRQTGSTWADFYVRNVQVKLREPIVYLPSGETENSCMVFYMADTVNHEGTYAGNVNMTQTIYPAERGKVLHLTGILDCENGYDYLTVYEGVGTNGNVLYYGTGYDANIDIKSSSYDWVNNGAMTIVFTSDVDNADQYLGFKLLARCECPAVAPEREWVVDTNTAFTWVNGRTYTNNVTVAAQPEKSWSEEYMEQNVGGCDSVYHTLQLTVHPTYTLTASQELCQREAYEFYGESLTETGVYTRTAQSIYGADSTTTLSLQVHPAPTAYIYVNNERTTGTIDAFCDNADLVMTARATIEGSTFAWEDNSTAAVRTVNPHENANYSVIAFDPTYNCPSLPVELAVTTTPVPVLSVEATEQTICAGATTTLTVTDANNTGCTYTWSNGQTGNSITVSPTTTTEYTVTATTPNASACTATASTTITVNALPVVSIIHSANQICRYDNLTLIATNVEGYSYNWTNINNATSSMVTFAPNSTGSYNLTVTDANGCSADFTSAVVTVRPAYNINDTLSICEAMLPYTWGTQTLEDVNGGDYEQTWGIAYGCDSTVHLHLDVTATGVSNAYATYCEGATFTFGQGEYQTTHVADLNTTSLSYVDTTSNVCPVQYNLYLTVNPQRATTVDVDECDSYTWNDYNYTTAGTYVQSLKTVNDCDSIVTMNLVLRHSNTGIDVQNPCDKLVWIDGNTYTEDNNTARYTIQNVAGCDSLVTLNLTLRHSNTGIDNIRWCESPEYTWINGVTYDMNETDGTVRYKLPDVSNQAGCDSVQILNLEFYLPADVMAWADTSACDILIIDTVACDGTIGEKQINQSGDYVINTPVANGRYVTSQFHVKITSSDYHTTVKRNVCLPYTWYDVDSNVIMVINNIYNASGDTNISLTYAQGGNGCDRTEVLRLIGAKPQSYDYVNAQVCLGESYSFGESMITPAVAGTETYTFPTGTQDVYGCDSYQVLTLTTYPSVVDTLEVEFCENDFVFGADNLYHYTFVNDEDTTESVDLTFEDALNGQPFSGSINADWTTEHGCARTVTVNFTVNPNTAGSFDTVARNSYTWNGVTYTIAGQYNDSYVYGQNQYGCDSTVTMNLTLYGIVYAEFDTVVCTSYEGPDHNIYRENKTFIDTLFGASQFGTDSIAVVNFFVNQNPLTDVFVASTDPYTWIDGVEYTADAEAFYTTSDAHGCDSTVHLFFTALDTIVLCEEALPFVTDYGFTITDAVSNTFSNNNAMGNDTIVSFTINQQTHNVMVDTACDNYTWSRNNQTYTMSGVYFYDYTNTYGCASADTLKLTVNYNTSSSETVTACDTYTWNNNNTSVTKTVSGTYYNNYLTANNCPSVDTLFLTVNYKTDTVYTVRACDSYVWNNSTYTASGDYAFEYFATNGCPSVDSLYLTIGNEVFSTFADTACDSYVWTMNGQTYTESNSVDTVVFRSINGCDSVITLNLVMYHNSNTAYDVTACDTYTWENNNNTLTKTESGDYFSTYTNADNCPSVDTLHLTINNNSNTAYSETVCDSYTWNINGNDSTITVSGTYYNSYNNATNGCPSVDTLYLVVNASEVHTDTIYSSEGTYEFIITANDVSYDTLFQSNTPKWFGPLAATFTNVDGCDSVVNYYFFVGTTRNRTEVVVACQEYTWPRNGETYVFINDAERAANNNALYKTINGTYIYEAPIITIPTVNGIDSTFILQLALAERYNSSVDTTFLLSNVTLALGDSIFDFSAEKAAKSNATVQRDVHYASAFYCDSVITYNIALVYNYDTTTDYICANQTSYQWGTQSIATTTPGSVYELDSVDARGWLRHVIITQAPVYASTMSVEACNRYAWIDGNTYTASDSTATKTLAAADGCDSVVTLNLTIKYSTHNSFTEAACDTYTWMNNDSTIVKTQSGVYTNSYTNADGCESVDTLHLTIYNNAGHDTTVTACQSFTWHETNYTQSTVAYFDYTDGNGCLSQDTLVLTINAATTGTDEITTCDSLTWLDGNTYYANNFSAQFTTTNAQGCDSVITLNLTLNYATHNVTVKANECDNYVWETSGQNYVYDANATYPLAITHSYINTTNCPSVDTLKLTLYQSTSETVDTTVCESFAWIHGDSIRTITESGTYTFNYANAAGCASTDILNLTVNNASTGSDEIIARNGYYIYNNILYTADRNGEDYFDTIFENIPSGVNVYGCDSTTTLHLLVGTDAIGMENQVVCDHFTWINGHTYIYREGAPNGALYYDATADEWVYSRPRYTLPGVISAHGFDTIAVLNLTLTQIRYEEAYVDFLLSQGICYLTADHNAIYSIDFTGAQPGTVDTAFHFGATSHYCDSIITFHITLHDNYIVIGNDDVCATDLDYRWNNTGTLGGHDVTYDLTELITDFDHVSNITLTDTVFKGDPNNEMVYAKILTVHPVVYATERRTACDFFEWHGTVFTESNSTATYLYPNGSSFGCDSTVTLNLTVNYNSNAAYTVSNACDSYTWTLNDETYTTSGTYYRSYNATNGCPSVDTLYLTVNYSTRNEEDVTACDSYTWHNTTYTTSDMYEYNYTNAGGCPAVDVLYLFINNSTHNVATVATCDSYEWTNNGSVFNFSESGTYYNNYTNAANCPSADTLHLTINKNNGQNITESVCDSYTWAANGQTYTQSGVYIYDSTDANGCYALCSLNLTVGYTTNNAETVTACNSYDWNNTTYTTSGTKLYSYINNDGCPSVDTLYLTINTGATYSVMNVENCGPYTWIVNDSVIGTIEQSVETSTSFINPRTMCDSVVFLRLTVYIAPHVYDTAVVCADALPYTWRGIEFNASCDTSVTAPFTANCDSTLHLNLTVNPLINVDLVDGICLGKDYDNYGFRIPAEELTAGTHIFRNTVPSVLTGCDSTTTLTINVGDVIYNEPVFVSACDSYTWNAGDGHSYDYTVSGSYESDAYLNEMGCKSVDVLKLTINTNSSSATTATGCDSFTWNDEVYTTSGDYTFAYDDVNGCASVDTLHLTVNYNSNTAFTATACDRYGWNGEFYTATGDYTYEYENTYGCPSVDTLHLTVNHNSNKAFTASACDSYTWNNMTYIQSGDYLYPYFTTDGCASVDTLHLTIGYNSNASYTASACESYEWNDVVYTASGNYLYTYNSTDGCASVDTLHLTIYNNTNTAYTVEACDSYEWNNQTFTTSGVYTFDYSSVAGCASVDTLFLTVNYNSNAAFTETACDSYTWNGTVYTASGDYTYSYNTTAGCASVDTLHLTVNYNSNSSSSANVCDSYSWNGNDYTTSGTYYYSYNTNEGCASVDTLYLTVRYNTNKQRTTIACNEYTWNGETYYQSGDYLYSYDANNGCPSVDTLHLTVNYSTSTSQSVEACDEYTWNGNVYTLTGMYIYDYIAANNCESHDTLMLTVNNSTSSNFTDAACNYYIWNGRAYTQSGAYDQTFTAANGCDSVVTLNLTVNTPQTTSINATACGSYIWNGATYTNSGSYVYNTTSAAGCDSIVTLTLTILQPVNTTITATACESYTWNGMVYTATGNYQGTYTAANNCDSIVTLALTINQPKYSTIAATACESYIWNGQPYTTSGNYTNTYVAANGCDSVVTLALTVNHGSAATVNVTACDSYTWMNGQTYTASTNTPTITLVNAAGCDSVITLNLTINNSTVSTTYMTACETYTWNGTAYTTSGTFTYNTTAANGCDSTATLVLTINQPRTSTLTATACDSYTWNGALYTTSGNYIQTYTAANGCDSVVTLALTVNQSTANTISATACDSYTWNGTAYTTSGNYTYTYNAANGCDSVVTLALTINQSVADALNATACDNFIWDGETYTTSGTFTNTYTAANGCDSVVTLTLTVNNSVSVIYEVTECDSYIWIDGVNYTESTNEPTVTMTTVNGCDSVITLHLTINHSVEVYDTIDITDNQLPYNYNGFTVYAAGDYEVYGNTATGCDSTVYLHVNVSHIGIEVVNTLDDITVYPNPSRGRVTVTADEVIKIEVLDFVGRLVATFENTNTFDISNLAEGAYNLRITLPEGVTVRKVIKK